MVQSANAKEARQESSPDTPKVSVAAVAASLLVNRGHAAACRRLTAQRLESLKAATLRAEGPLRRQNES